MKIMLASQALLLTGSSLLESSHCKWCDALNPEK